MPANYWSTIIMQQELNNALKILEQGGLIVYPTDTIWGIGCDATNFDAIQKIYKLKQREESKSMISIVCDFDMLQTYQYHFHFSRIFVCFF